MTVVCFPSSVGVFFFLCRPFPVRFVNTHTHDRQTNTHHSGHAQVSGQRVPGGARQRWRAERVPQGPQHRNVPYRTAGNDLREYNQSTR